VPNEGAVLPLIRAHIVLRPRAETFMASSPSDLVLAVLPVPGTEVEPAEAADPLLLLTSTKMP